ncbi:MAG TPA: hypothetical protein VMM58_09260 [Bacteroidota bacterium]|nr:hypothetical protein [Bacteroidota bacterium]
MIIPPVFNLPLMYAETHYRFKYFFSLLKKAEPEILADVPYRLEPDAALPILLIVKDSNAYPVELVSVKIDIWQDEHKLSVEGNDFPEHIARPFWWKIIRVTLEKELKEIFGFLDVDVTFEYRVGGKIRTCRNDNYRTSSRKQFRVYRSRNPLPTVTGCIQGDAHTHSSYTDDQVEFGSPVEASVEMSKSMGLSFFCVTDHSYDLDDRIDNYLINDPSLPKWKLLQSEIDKINDQHKDFAVIRGEEVSCFNRMRRNVHLLLWGTRKFFNGSGDSAEKWFHTKAEHTIREILDAVESGTVAYAGHPTERAPFFQWLLIRRGEWGLDDMNEAGLFGIQILNGVINEAFADGLEQWKVLLLRGKRTFIAAGDDAHGNFNRFRQIGIPFVSLRENHLQLFAKMRTLITCDAVSEDSVLTSLREGRSAITNGPVIAAKMANEFQELASFGQSIRGKRLQIQLTGQSSEEFGSFHEIRLIIGIIGSGNEIIKKLNQCVSRYYFDVRIDFEIPRPHASCYIRFEGFTEGGVHDNGKGICYTNPIWIIAS